MSDTVTVEMDCYSDDALGPGGKLDLDMVKAIATGQAAAFNVSARLVNPSGPGGGSPVFAFTGKPEDVRAYLRAHHNPGLEGQDLEDELDYYMGLEPEDGFVASPGVAKGPK